MALEQIQLQDICKTFLVNSRKKGRFGLFSQALSREREQIHALKNVSFSISEGELVGYIGPNGAGKSTTVKIMGGILTPTKGTCQILGHIPWKDRISYVSKIGVVFGQRSQLFWDVPVYDSFLLLKDIYRIPRESFQKRNEELSAILDLGALVNTPVRQLSLGQRMRCEVAAALLHSPKILFLDEPTIGLDALSKLSLRAFLKKENKEHGVTMILTTHDMDDIEALSSRVLVIGHGELLFDGNLTHLKARYSPLRIIRATLDGPSPMLSLPQAEKVEIRGNTWKVFFDPQKISAPKMVAQLAENLPLQDMVMEEEKIEEVIAHMYKEMRL